MIPFPTTLGGVFSMLVDVFRFKYCQPEPKPTRADVSVGPCFVCRQPTRVARHSMLGWVRICGRCEAKL